jgi:hypothetical protein
MLPLMEARLTAWNAALLGLVMLAVTLGILYGLYGLGGTEVQAQGQTGTCPSAQLIDEFSGTGAQETDTFNTTTDSFRVSYDLSTTPDLERIGTGPALSITIESEGRSVGLASKTDEGSGETFVNEPPGTYNLDIVAAGEYDITVEQCEGGNPDTNPIPGSTTPQKTQTPPAPAPKTPATPPKTPPPAPKTPAPAPKDSGTLMNAGGPTTGPMPLMPDGSCPREFPTMRYGACYPA